MDPETIKAIGEYVVTPICVALIIWAIVRAS